MPADNFVRFFRRLLLFGDTPMIEDAELLCRYAEDASEDAFAELVRRRIGLVFFVALRQTRDVQRAEDVAQSVFTDLARKAATLSRHPVLVGWLYRSAQFAATDVMRAVQSRTLREKETQIMHETLGHHDPGPEWEQVRPVLDQVIGELNEHDRDAILLRFFDGRPFADIGVRLQLSENSARMRVERALDKLHSLLARRGVTSTTAALGVALANQASVAAPAGLAATVTGSALASAGTSAGAFLAFMSTSKSFVGAIGMLAAVALGTAVYQTAALHRRDIALANATADRESLQAKLREGESRATAATEIESLRSDDLAAFRRYKEDMASQRALAKQRATEAKEIYVAQERFVLSPAIQQRAAQQFRANLSLRYGPLYVALRFSPDEISKFEAVMNDKFWTMSDLVSAAKATGLPDTATTNIKKQALDLVDEKLLAELGESKYREYLQYDLVVDTRELTDALASKVYYSNSPLSAQQADKLTELLAANRTKSVAPNEWLRAQVFARAGPALSWTWACLERMDTNSGGFDVFRLLLYFVGHR